MTPEVLEFGYILDGPEPVVYELSKGRGIFDDTIYGVSVVRMYRNGETERLTDVSQCCGSRAEAVRLIAHLREEFDDGTP
jgi:hypothetical protein